MTDLTREGLVLLAARVEAADGVSFTLNGDIAESLGLVPSHCTMKRGMHEASDRWLAGGLIHYQAPNFTGSVDAALALVPEGLWAEGSLSSPGQLEVHGPCTYEPLGKGWAATPALALCAAALKARARAMEAGRG
ncbi:hypothetical protein [Sphingomonas melonis]|uniref:hypothetical protein n=1 Tax=Sphingomonas melonis TaxID=152682 RepID=UPI0036DDAD39